MVSQPQSSEHNNNKLYSIPHKFTDYELTPHCELKPLPDKSKNEISFASWFPGCQ